MKEPQKISFPINHPKQLSYLGLKSFPFRLTVFIIVWCIFFSAIPACSKEKTFTNFLKMTFVLIPSGGFIMGSPIEEAYRGVSEIQHHVTISKPFYMQNTEVTVAQWRAVMGRRFIAKKRGTPTMPVVKVSWHDCDRFIKKLNQLTGHQYALPTEAQWEYAARAGSTTAYFWGDGIECARAMYANNPKKYDTCVDCNRASVPAVGCPAHVRGYPPNAWGLYDMHGNVWEWCLDRFDRYDPISVVDPMENDSGTNRVRRGGSWFSPGHSCRSANRAYGHPMSRLQTTGFRLVLVVR